MNDVKLTADKKEQQHDCFFLTHLWGEDSRVSGKLLGGI